jgi:glycosyltransferase involved in cell wall biosynthesis
MRIVHFASLVGPRGAASASLLLHECLQGTGQDSSMITLCKETANPAVKELRPGRWFERMRRLARHAPGLRRYTSPSDLSFNTDRATGISPGRLLEALPHDPEIFCVHWISGLLNTRTMLELHRAFPSPIVWIMVDQEPVTGGCHYSGACERYKTGCGQCPLLAERHLADSTRRVWRAKKRCFDALDPVIVAPTGWCSRMAHEGPLLHGRRVEKIPLPIDTALFRPLDRRIAREVLAIPPDKFVVFLGAQRLQEPRKGMKLLWEALALLPNLLSKRPGLSAEDVFLFIAGKGEIPGGSLPFPFRCAGELRDGTTLALAYQAADLFICPSTEDAGPMMVPESLLCGTPVVAFETGSAEDLIRDMETGYLVRKTTSEELAAGIGRLLDRETVASMRVACAARAKEAHAPEVVAARHLSLYRELIRAKEESSTGSGRGRHSDSTAGGAE